MAHPAKPDEAKLLSADEVLTPESMSESFPMVAVKVVYLGSHPYKTERLHGQIELETIGQRLSPEEPLDRKLVPSHVSRRMDKTGYTVYDFSKLDSRKRPRKDLLTGDGHRYVPCEHLAHMLAFYRMKDAEGQAMYQIRGEPEALEVLKRYRDAVTRRANPDFGDSVLKDMEDVLSK
jgi:hypothetical protein